MTPTELWDIYYHAVKQWMPKATDNKVRKFVGVLMDLSCKEVIKDEEHETMFEDTR